MKLSKIITGAFLTILLIFAFAMTFSSCSSIKKQKQSESLKTEKSTSIDSSSQAAVKKEEDKKVAEEKKEESIYEGTEINLKPGDSLEVTNYDKDGKKTGSKKYKGSGSVKDYKESKKKQESKVSEVRKKSDSIGSLDVSKDTKDKSSGNSSFIDKNKKGFSFGDYIFWFLLIIAIIVLVYLNNRFKWITLFNKKSNE